MTTPSNSVPLSTGDLTLAPNSGAFDPRTRLWGGRRQRSEELKSLHWAQITANWKYYRGFITPYTDVSDWWRSNEVIPTNFKIIETIMPRLLLGLFDNPDWFNVEARNQRNEQYETLCQNLLRTKIEQMRAFPKFYEAIKYAQITGHAWGKVYWREEYQKRQVVMPRQEVTGIDEQGNAQMRTVGVDQHIRDEEVFNGPDFDWLTVDRLWPDPSGRERWYLEEIDTTLEELEEEQEKLGIYDQAAFDDMVAYLPNSRITGTIGGLDSIADARRGTTAAGVSVEYIREPTVTENIPWHLVTPMRDGVGVKLWQCWGWCPRECRPKGEEDIPWRLQVIVNGKWVLRDVPAPTPDMRPPYFPIRSIVIPKRLYGASVLEYIGPLVDQQSRLANMRMDEVYLNVWSQYIMRKGALASDNQTFFQPGGWLEVNAERDQSLNDVIAPLVRRPVLPEAYKEDQYRQMQAEDASSATDVLRGVSGSDRQTATEVERMLQQGNARHTLSVMLLEYTFKKELLHRTWQWLQMRMTRAERVKVGEEYADVDLQHIQEPVDIVVGGGLFAISKAQRVSMDQQLIGLAQVPQAAQIIKWPELLQKFLQDSGWKNPARYVLTPEEIQHQQAQQQLMGLMQAQQGGPGGNGNQAGANPLAALVASAGGQEGGQQMPGMSQIGAANGMVGQPPPQGGPPPAPGGPG